MKKAHTKKDNEKTSKKILLITQAIKPENYFYLCNGRMIKNILELCDELNIMDNEIFSYHTNDQKNDFANWIRDIFDDRELADELMLIKDKNKTNIAILRRIVKQLISKKHNTLKKKEKIVNAEKT